MAKVRFYPFDIGYRVVEGRPQVYLYGRKDTGEQVCVVDESLSPYFFVAAQSGARARELLNGLEAGLKEKITGTKEVAKKRLGKPVNAIKIMLKLPSDVPLVREGARKAGLETYEDDILFARRYLLDMEITPLTLCEAEGEVSIDRPRVELVRAREESVKQIGDEVIEPRLLSFDIETYYDPSKSLGAVSESPILMIALAGNNFRKVITWKRFDTKLDYIEFVESELSLIERFKEVIREYKPDILAGYFSDRFDLPYLSQRARKYKIPLDIGLDGSAVEIRPGDTGTAAIRGIIHLDIYKFIRRVLSVSMNINNYSLDAVARDLLGEKKISIDFSEMNKAWDENLPGIEEFCKYNLHDAELTYRLAEKVMPSLYEMVKIVGLPLYDLSRMSLGQISEAFLIKRVQEFKEVVPPRPSYQERSLRMRGAYAGAFVYEPTPGLYNNIAIFDFRSLYPTIISAHNISPDTINCKCCAAEAELTPDDAGSKNWFCKKRKGFVSAVIEDIIKRRMRIKEITRNSGEKDRMLEARQLVLKYIGASMYGYLGFAGARWYSIDCARAITAYGRHYITTVIDSAKKEGFKVLYSDTDSIFLALEEKTEKDVTEFIERINVDLPGLMELEYEGFYPAGIFVSTKAKGEGAKKRYALISKEGRIIIKGFETVRRNLSPIAKEIQLEVLKIILKERDSEKALKYVQDKLAELRENRIPIEKTTITTQLTKDIRHYDSIGPHVAAAQRMRDRGVEVGAGTMVSYVVVPGEGKIIRDRVRLPEEISQGEYDPEYYVMNQVVPAVEKIFEVFGYEKEKILGEKKQSRLSSYFR